MSEQDIQAIIDTYNSGLSFRRTGMALGKTESRVRFIMYRHAPGSIRSRKQAGKIRGKIQEEGPTLTALELHYIGKCHCPCGCGLPLVGPKKDVKKPICGICKAAA